MCLQGLRSPHPGSVAERARQPVHNPCKLATGRPPVRHKYLGNYGMKRAGRFLAVPVFAEAAAGLQGCTLQVPGTARWCGRLSAGLRDHCAQSLAIDLILSPVLVGMD